MGWQEIPEDILLEIFEKFSAKDLTRTAVVCKHWSSIAENNLLWKKIFLQQLKDESAQNTDAYMHQHNIESAIEKKLLINKDICWKEEFLRRRFGLPEIKAEVLLNQNHYDPMKFCVSSCGNKIAVLDEDCFLRIYERNSRNESYRQLMKRKITHFDWSSRLEFSPSSGKLLVVSKIDKERCLQIELFECKELGCLINSYKIGYGHRQKLSHFATWSKDNNTILISIHDGMKIAVWIASAVDKPCEFVLDLIETEVENPWCCIISKTKDDACRQENNNGMRSEPSNEMSQTAVSSEISSDKTILIEPDNLWFIFKKNDRNIGFLPLNKNTLRSKNKKCMKVVETSGESEDFELSLLNDYLYVRTKRIEILPYNIQNIFCQWLEINLMEENFEVKIFDNAVLEEEDDHLQILAVSRNYMVVATSINYQERLKQRIVLIDKNFNSFLTRLSIGKETRITQLAFIDDEEFITASYRNALENDSFRIRLWSSKRKAKEKLKLSSK